MTIIFLGIFFLTAPFIPVDVTHLHWIQYRCWVLDGGTQRTYHISPVELLLHLMDVQSAPSIATPILPSSHAYEVGETE